MSYRNAISRNELLNILDPMKKNPKYATLSVPELMKILHNSFNQYRSFSDDEFESIREYKSPIKKSEVRNYQESDYVRPPDRVYSEQLLPSRQDLDYDPEDQDMKKAIDESLKTYDDEEIGIDFDDLATESDINFDDLATVPTPVKETPLTTIVEHRYEDIPDDFNMEILETLYKELKELNFVQAKKIISEIPILNHMEWVKSLMYNNVPLKVRIQNKDPESYKCIRQD